MKFSLIACAFSAGLLASDACARCLANETQKIVPFDAEAGDEFGGVTAINDDVIMVASYDDDGGEDAGAIYVYRFNPVVGQYVFEQKLIASDAAPGDQFTWPIIAGNMALVGAWGDDDAFGEDLGSHYVFRFDGTTWIEEAKLIPSDLEAGDGVPAPHTDGYTIAIGVSFDDDAADDAGAIYVYERDGATWVEQAKIVADTAAAGETMGFPVVIDGDRIIAGAYLADGAQPNAGAAYIFRKMGTRWVQEARLTASDGESFDLYGLNANIIGDVAVVGSFGSDESTGAAYVYRYDSCIGTWGDEVKLVASDAQPGDEFGGDIQFDGENTLVVSSWSHDSAGVDAGAAYVFTYDGETWNELAKLTASDRDSQDFFANSTPIDNGTIAIGCRFDDAGAEDSGSLYVVRGISDCNRNGILDLCDITAGTSTDINGDGVPDECQTLACTSDLDGNGVVNAADLAQLLGSWGLCQ